MHNLYKAPLESEIININEFVKAGGILIVSGGTYSSLEGLAMSYGLIIQGIPRKIGYSRRYSEEPLYPKYPVGEILVQTEYIVNTANQDIAVLYGSEDKAVVLTLRYGAGRVFFTTSSYLFSTNGMENQANATLFYNLMSTLPNRGFVGLAQLNYFTEESKPPNTFVELVFKTPGGLAAIYACVILFIFLTLRGRRFGKPSDILENHRRMSTEYIHAMTTLYQKGNTRSDILKHIRHKFRTELGLRWRVDPTLDTSAFLKDLRNRGALDVDDELTELIRDLERIENRTERQLLEIAKRVEEYRETYRLRRSKIT